MDPLTAVVVAYRAKQAAVARRTADLLAQQWARVDAVNPAVSWARQIPAAVNITRQGMQASATGSTRYVGLTVRAQGVTPDPAGTVDASAFAASAADGRPLGSLLYLPAITADKAASNGLDLAQALQQGQDQLLMIVLTEVADAGSGGVSAAMMADREVTGYYRQPGPSACADCAILAGVRADTFEAAAFQRHPACQCTAIAATEHYKANTTAPTATDYFNSLSAGRQDAVFGQANSAAIRDGADPAAVINTRRGWMRDATTSESATRMGLYGGYSRNADGSLTRLTRAESAALPPRLTPTAIYQRATSREDAVAMLHQYGYIR